MFFNLKRNHLTVSLPRRGREFLERSLLLKERRSFRLRAILIAIAATFFGTIALLFLLGWLIIGPQGLTLLEGLAMIDLRFVGDYDRNTVLDSAMNGMIAGTGDRWSYYLNATAYEAQKLRRNNEYVGIGVMVSYEREEGLLITAVNAGGPAEKAGLRPGEIITAVDGTSLAGEARHGGSDLVRGEEGTQISLTLLEEDGSTRTAAVVRKAIEEDPVSWTLLPDGIGYIQVENFYLRSAEQVKEAAETLQSQGATALLFDMRNNGGGYLNELTAMLDTLLPEGPIFRSQSRTGNEQVVQSDSACIPLPMATLVNQDTYSAAELFAAELQEKIGAPIVGVPTSGKGYSQQTYPLFSGGAVSISTHKYFTGEGVSLIGTGLTLDREVPLSDQEAAALWAGTLPYDQDPQLQAALELLHNSSDA